MPKSNNSRKNGKKVRKKGMDAWGRIRKTTRTQPKVDKYTRYISKDVLVAREKFVADAAGRSEDVTADKGREMFYAVMTSPAERMPEEDWENYKTRQWLRGVAYKFWRTSFKNRVHNHILLVDGEYK
jgi:hypothetical protein